MRVVAPLLPLLPRDREYRIVFMERPLEEVVRSQKVMLQRLRRPQSRLPDERLLHVFQEQLDRVRRFLARSTRSRVIFVRYADVLSDPAEAARRVNGFLGGALDERRMQRAIEPDLRRVRWEARPVESRNAG